MKKPNVMKIFNTVKKAVEKKSPEILIAFGIAGMITTTVLAVKATPKAMEKIKEVEKNKKEEFDRDHGYSELDTMFKLTKPEVVKATWKCYIPAAISGATSIACIVGANTVHSKRNAAIATAYKLSEKALTEYKEATIEEVGKEKAKAIKDRVAQKQLDNNPVNDSQVIITGNGKQLCYDGVSGRYFESSIQEIETAVNKMVPVYTTADPMLTDSYDILSMRTGKILEWYPEKVLVQVYNERTGEKEDILLSKRQIGIVENPLYSIINEQNSTFKRLSRKLSLLDVTDERTASGKLDLLIQLPYAIKSEARRNQAETRRTDIEKQLTGSKYGVAYIDSTEKVVQLNRSLENNLMKQIEYLQDLLYSQLGITQEVLNGTADEKTMLNYMNRTVEPFVSAIADEMKRKFLSKTARTQGQSIMYFRDPFKLVPVSSVAEIADKFTRNEIMTANEIRQVIGMKPSKDPKADELRNSNISQAKEDLAETHKNQEGGDRGQNE